MDLLYPLSNESGWNNNEIRYSLRSMEKHISGIDRLFIVGEKPDFLTDFIHIEMSDPNDCREMNIMEKIRAACVNGISQKFLFCNDDHFILKDYEATKFPYYSDGTLSQAVHKHTKDNYKNTIRNTINVLKDWDLPANHFDLHCPIVYDREKFVEIVDSYVWKGRPTYVIKSLYCNSLNIAPVPCKDNKYMMKGKINLQHPFLSLASNVDRNTRRELERLFSKKSRWEI
jgi:hypothetical protein